MIPRSSTAGRTFLPLGCALALAASLAGPDAFADDKTTAEALFQAARTLMDEGKYAEACPKFAESQRLDPGGGTLLNLALCHEKEGKTATAWSEYKEGLGVARSEGRDDRVKFATDNIAAIEPRLSRLTVTVGADAKIPGLVVTVDGTQIGEPAWGIATPYDPGARRVAATAPGRTPWQTTIQLGPVADQQTVSVPLLEPGAAEPTPAPTATTSGPAPSGAPAVAPPTGDAGSSEPSDGSTQQVAGYVIGAAGLVSVVIGGVFGGLAMSAESEAEETCDETTCTTLQGLNASDDANTNATLANAFVFGGIGLVAVGLVVVLTAPSAPEEAAAAATTVTPWVGPSEAGLVGRFVW
jgi:hypothetical protein